MTQLTIDDIATAPAPETQQDGPLATIGERFTAYHAAHPEVYSLLVRFARQAKASGTPRYGIKALFERVRWHIAVERQGGEFKLNNNYTSRYARLIQEREPDLAGFFETRELKAA